MDDAGMLAEHAALLVHDLARPRRVRRDPLDHPRIIAVGYKADVLAIGLVGHGKTEILGQRADARLFHSAQWEAQGLELRARGAEEKIALIAREVGSAVQLRPG